MPTGGGWSSDKWMGPGVHHHNQDAEHCHPGRALCPGRQPSPPSPAPVCGVARDALLCRAARLCSWLPSAGPEFTPEAVSFLPFHG